MAKLSAHGETVGTLEFLTTAKRYMSDGNILRNVGFGWKLYAKVKGNYIFNSLDKREGVNYLGYIEQRR